MTGATDTGATSKPLVIAHRGASISHAEHTMAAYETALDEGADGFECDVRLTLDSVMVCLHDRKIDRTSNGHAVVSTSTYADLVTHDYGSWHDPDQGSSQLLTLRQLLDFATLAPRPVSLSIETKHPVRYGGQIERHLVKTLKQYGLDDPSKAQVQVRVMSFSSVALRRMRSLAPQIPTVFLMDRVPLMHRDGTLPQGVPIAGPGIHILREHPHYVERVHKAGNKVHVWTVDEPDDVQLCLNHGVDAIITNKPGFVKGLINAST